MKAIDLAAVVGAGDSPEDAGFDEEAYLGGGGVKGPTLLGSITF